MDSDTIARRIFLAYAIAAVALAVILTLAR